MSVCVSAFRLCGLFLLAASTLGGHGNLHAQNWPLQTIDDNLIGAWTRSGDLDLDGDADVIVQNGDTLFWYENSPSGWERHLIDPLFMNSEYSWVEELDLDQDGDLDVLQLPFTNPSVVAWNENVMNGTLWVRHVIMSDGRSPAVTQGSSGDIDLDGTLDLVIPEYGTGEVSWFERQDSGASWLRHPIGASPGLIWSTVADIDGDDDPDVVSGSYSTGAVYWCENQFPDTSWAGTYLGSSYNTLVGECADIDGDGDRDVVTHSNTALVYYENPTWNAVTIAAGFSELQLGRLGDLDGDGDIDVTYGGTGFGTMGDLGWMENPGGSGDWSRHDIADGSPEQRVPTGLEDIDGDGDIDIVAYSFDVSSTVGDAFWLANPAITSGVQEIAAPLPGTYELQQNYPNPFNPTTTIRFSLPTTSFTVLKICSSLGEEVATLANGLLRPGDHQFVFDGTGLAAGVYFCRLVAEGQQRTMAMLLLK
jgi:hypothetical protein